MANLHVKVIRERRGKGAHGFPIGQFEFDFKKQIVIGQITMDGVSDTHRRDVIADAE